MVQRRDDTLEVGALGLLQTIKDILEAGAEGIADDFGALEGIERVDPGRCVRLLKAADEMRPARVGDTAE